MSKRKSNEDEDYFPDKINVVSKKFNNTKRTRKSNNTNSFLDENSSQIIQLHRAGSKPKEIASALCSSKSLKPGSVTGKQISSWISYRKNSGQLKTRPVSLENNNLGVDFADDWYEDAHRYGKSRELQEDVVFSVDEDGESDSEATDVASACKYGRILKIFGETHFAVIVETNLNRKITVTPSSDHGSVLLNFQIPIPPDEMIIASGFHAVEVSLSKVDETFTIHTGRKISTTTQTIFWPNEETPLWITFKFAYEKETEETSLTYDINLVDKLVGKK